MNFRQTDIKDVWIIEPELRKDERGFFARIVCENEFKNYGLNAKWVQQNISGNLKKGTLRGMHYQKGSAAEIKAIRCTKGAVFDVAVDIRPGSETRYKWVGAELTAENHRMIYIPEGFAHGYITLSEEAEITYLVSNFYTPGQEGGIRFDDPVIGIDWPIKPQVISEKDQAWAYIGDN